ncbi:glycosyltransferase [Arthrobacter caoxuetaonis]|uniref:Glycosyltransferase n=1 Tax=Arthrobacter caoxuetaonis TaxID=2886935 RepID=A0A9X1SAL8_9MICC|nr:glycosyltransferase [Arthrobacter caoxuetaonis]MCC3296785.1 glycosyltransferase [Arthrobacter caoxuetaonis]USQ56397.1 glycosyltransferase [Arthrobacter caoxuetaonis]
MPLDIFIPYWGDPDYMMETVQSVLAQTSDDWLLTVVDDAYPDTTIKEYFAGVNDPRIRYVRKPQNEGITANYRTCVEMATQEVMTILGCDDVLLPNYVETVIKGHRKFPGAAIIQPGVQVIDEDGRITRTMVDTVKQNVVQPRAREYRILSGEALAANLLHGDWLYWPSLAFRVDKIREVEFREGFPIIQDLALVMDMIFKGDQLLLIDTLCFSYRRHTASASSSKLVDGSRFAGERDYFSVAAQQAKELGWFKAERAANARITSRAHALTLLPKALISQNTAAARVLFRHGFGR